MSLNLLDRFVKAVKSANGADVSLRSVFPGRGRQPTKDRADVLAFFAETNVNGVFRDRRRGVFNAVHQPMKNGD